MKDIPDRSFQKITISEAQEEIRKLTKRIDDVEHELEDVYSSREWVLVNIIKNNKLIKLGLKSLLFLVSLLQKIKGLAFDLPNEKKILSNLNLQLEGIPVNANIAIHHPEWMGVRHSTEDLFDYCIPLGEVNSKRLVKNAARNIVKRNVRSVTFSGFAVGYAKLARELKRLNNEIKLHVFWHGNTTHMYEKYSWERHCEVTQLFQEGVLSKWGFAKESMVDVYRSAGFTTAFLKNSVPSRKMGSDTEYNKDFQLNNIKIGLYASGETWNKNTFTQIAAAKLIDNTIIHAIPYTKKMQIFAEQMGVRLIGNRYGVSREKMKEYLGDNTINFYVTFSECSPLLPLESLNQGVPCLTGPNHHYFKGTPLRDYLVVNEPDNPIEIATKAIKAIENRYEIIELYEKWAHENEVESRQLLDVFLEE